MREERKAGVSQICRRKLVNGAGNGPHPPAPSPVRLHLRFGDGRGGVTPPLSCRPDRWGEHNRRK